jgi:hypothetical protein
MVMNKVKASLLVSKKLGVVGRTMKGKRRIYSKVVKLINLMASEGLLADLRVVD